jgi:hypothetical protein
VEAILLGPDQQPYDLTLATSLHIIWKKSGTSTRRPATIDDPPAGAVGYDWEVAYQNLPPGDYKLEFDAGFPPPQSPQTFPCGGPHPYVSMKIWPDLG